MLDVREELVRQFADLEACGVPPIHQPPRKKGEFTQFEADHIPRFSELKQNCKVCYILYSDIL